MMDKYQILAINILTSSTKMMLNDFIFQQVTDPKHASKYAKYMVIHLKAVAIFSCKNKEELKLKVAEILGSNPSRFFQNVGNVDTKEDIRMYC